MLKRWISSSSNDLLTVLIAFERAIVTQTNTIKREADSLRIRTPKLNRELFSPCFGLVTNGALWLVEDHRSKNAKSINTKACSGVFTRTMGLPCAHTCVQRLAAGQSLGINDFHLHWHWDRYNNSVRQQSSVLEPLFRITKKSQRDKQQDKSKGSNSRILSGFERTEFQIEGPKCGACGIRGHIRTSKKCIRTRDAIMVAQLESLGPERASRSSSPELEVIMPLVVDPKPADNRPIWPGRVEVIYETYLAIKSEWLAVNKVVREKDYRKKAGLKDHNSDAGWCTYHSKFMPTSRLDLTTELLLPGRPHWKREEIEAFVDDEKRQDDAMEARDLAKFKAQGNFGVQKRGLGVRQDFVTGFVANTARDKVRYRFSDITEAASM